MNIRSEMNAVIVEYILNGAWIQHTILENVGK